MKRIICILGLICISITFLGGCTSYEQGEVKTYSYDEVNDSLIRFHVIASSDTKEDQDLKIKVKDRVIEYIYPYLKKSQSIEESREILTSKKEDILKIAKQVIDENGYSYGVQGSLSRENFPAKTYGNIELPQGEYEAFRIIIGNGQGKNWWCVMFPPLCFVDVTKGKVQEEECKKELDEQIEKKQDETPKVKFKILEWLKEI